MTASAPPIAPDREAGRPESLARRAIPPETNAAPAAAERRQHQRVELETEVSFASENNFFTGFTEDISEGGLFLATYQLEPIGTAMEITFHLPDGHIVRARGQVRWVRDPRDESPGAPPGMGIQFEELLPEDRRAIQAFIEARAPLFYEE
ncbi:MAG: TIGR02266 family protein [Myxococcota bacterium]